MDKKEEIEEFKKENDSKTVYSDLLKMEIEIRSSQSGSFFFFLLFNI